MMTPNYEGPERRREPGVVPHACTQEARLAQMEMHLSDIAMWQEQQEGWQARQNGSLQRMEATVAKVHDVIIDRLPQDLPQRLRQLEADGNQKRGAVSLARWMVGLFGVGALAAVIDLLFAEGGLLHGVVHWLGL